MKSMEELVAEELEKSGCVPAELEELNLDERCRSKSVVGLDAFVGLKELSLCHVGITTLEGFPILPNLKSLQLADNKISSGLGKLCGLKSLEKLNLVHNDIASIEELRPLSELNIKWLDLFACPVEETEGFREKVFEALPSLEVLDDADKFGKGASGSDENSDSEYGEDDDDEEEEEGSAGVSGEEDVGEGDGTDSSDAGEEEDESEDEEPEANALHVDISMLVGPPIDDSEQDEDYQEDGDDVESEEVVDDADADADEDEDEEFAYSACNSAQGTEASDGTRKRKFEEQGEGSKEDAP